MTRADAEPTPRLVQVLLTYCRELRPSGIHDLHAALRAGRYPWLHDELAAAIRASGGDDSWWRNVIGEPVSALPGRQRPVRAEQRQLWRALFPEDPFPA